jgi:hypothetical protein
MYSSTLSLTSASDRGWVVNAKHEPLYPRNDSVPVAKEAGSIPGPVLTAAEYLTATGIRSPDRQIRKVLIPLYCKGLK